MSGEYLLPLSTLDETGKVTTEHLLVSLRSVVQRLCFFGATTKLQELVATTGQPMAAVFEAADGEPVEGSPLFIAAVRGHLSTVRFLLADVGVDIRRAMPATLVAASREGHSEVVRTLLMHDILPVDAMYTPTRRQTTSSTDDDDDDDDASFALLEAASNGHARVVDLLLAATASVNLATPRDGATALFAAAQQGHADVVALLLAAGADATLCMRTDGASPLYVAVLGGHADVAALLCQRLPAAALPRQLLLVPSADDNALRAAVEIDDDALLTAVLRRVATDAEQALLDAEPAARRSLAGSLFAACKRGRHTAVEALLRRWPTDRCAVDAAPDEPFVAAAGRGRLAVLQLLADAYAWPVDSRSRLDGASALFVAAQQGRSAVVHWLLQRGADPNLALQPSATTPLMAAVQAGRLPVVDLLLADHRTNVNAATSDTAATALHVAAQTGNVDAVQRLVHAKSDLCAKTTDGQTPLVIATQSHHSTHPVIHQLLSSLRSSFQ